MREVGAVLYERELHEREPALKGREEAGVKGVDVAEVFGLNAGTRQARSAAPKDCGSPSQMAWTRFPSLRKNADSFFSAADILIRCRAGKNGLLLQRLKPGIPL